MARLPPIKALFLDFDSTISTPIFVDRARKWAVADDVALFRSMTPEERLANLGGSERLAALQVLLHDLVTAGVTLYIVSIGHRSAFGPHLQEVGIIAQSAESAARPGRGANGTSRDGSRPLSAEVDCGIARPLSQARCPICPSRVYGQDSPALRSVHFVKATLIGQLMGETGLGFADALFVDDSLDHIDKASVVCRTLHVAHRRGMQQQEFDAIRAAAGLL
eukprot:scaffold208523_cov35-Tisochrysis_lutea.AAC.1